MLVNSANLNSLRVGFKTSFQGGLAMASTMHTRISTPVPSSLKEQKYGWLGKIPNVREWIGPRAIQNLEQHDYSIKEKPWELTIGVDKDDIETDNLGIYGPMFQEMGQSTGAHWDQLVFNLLAAGFTMPCYDGQYYFDTDHPVRDANGNEISVANTDGGAGARWFLMDASRALKPIILQKRKDFDFVAMDDPKDENVFKNKEFIYGSDARGNVGFGFWQFCWGSGQALDADHYELARVRLSEMKGDYGRPLGLMPNLLMVPPSLEGRARKLINNELGANGETNEWQGTAEVVVCPWLA